MVWEFETNQNIYAVLFRGLLLCCRIYAQVIYCVVHEMFTRDLSLYLSFGGKSRTVTSVVVFKRFEDIYVISWKRVATVVACTRNKLMYNNNTSHRDTLKTRVVGCVCVYVCARSVPRRPRLLYGLNASQRWIRAIPRYIVYHLLSLDWAQKS